MTTGDVLEVEGGMLWVRDEVAARSEARVEAVACSKCGERESTRPKILGHGDLIRDAPLLCASPFSSYVRRAHIMCVSHFIEKGDGLVAVRLTLIQKQDV
jgi:hypothetical protein